MTYRFRSPGIAQMTSRSLIVALAALPLAGCISLGAKPPATLMTLAPAATQPAGPATIAQAGTSVTVYVPSAPPELGGLRVPVKAGANAVAYLKDAQWADAPARLFRNLLAETITARTGRVTLYPRQYTLAPGLRLSGRLSDFGLDATGGRVVATYDAQLIRKDGGALETRRFRSEVPVAAQDSATVAAALSEASNAIAAQVADWIGRG